MPRITPIHWKRFEKFLLFVGCEFKRQKGDHRVYDRNGLKRPVIVPADGELSISIIKSNLRTLGMSNSEYLAILDRV